MIITRDRIDDSLQVLRNLYCEKAYDHFSGYAREDDMQRLIFIKNMLKDENQFFVGKVNPMCSNLTTLWLYEHQGYHFHDALRMSYFRCERGWESQLNSIMSFAKYGNTDDELNPWRKRQQLFYFKDLYGLHVHRVHPHKRVAIVSFIFTDGHNEFQSKQMIVKNHGNNKYYLSQDEHCNMYIVEDDFTKIYSFLQTI